MFGQRKNSIAHRLVVWVILISTSVAVLTTALQLYLDYRQELREISTFFESLSSTSLRPLEESVWILDDLQIGLQLEGLIKHQDIVHAAVDMNGQVAWSKGQPIIANSVVHRLALYHKTPERRELIGHLRVTASLDGVYSRLWRRVMILLLSNSLKSFFVAGLILLLLQKSLTRHLLRLAEHVQTLDIRDRQPATLELERKHASPPDELDQVVDAFNAVSESGHRAYFEVRAQEERLRLFLDSTGEAVLGVDLQGKCSFVNKVALTFFLPGVAEEIIGQDIQVLLAAEYHQDSELEGCLTQIRRSLRERLVLSSEELQLRRRDGRTLTVVLRSHPLIENDRCRGVLVFIVDLSTLQRFEQEKQLFAKTMRQTPALIAIADATGLIEFVNPSFENILGRRKEEVVGTHALDMLLPFGIKGQLEGLREALRTGSQWTGRLNGRAASSTSSVTLDVVISPVLDAEERMTNIIAVARDVTLETELMLQLYHAQKMEAMGKLASSIAHEFGNPLLGIRFALRDVQKRPELSPGDLRLLQLAESECDRMRVLIRDLQQFNRPSTGKRNRFALHRVLDELLLFHRKFLATRNIELVKKYDSQAIALMVVEDQLRQVFVNLIINAGDAMAAEGGVLTVSTTSGDRGISVSFADSGPGIKEEHLERIFEPFFTTKSAVEGTGLGLSVSYGIVKAHGGTFEVRSAPGDTVFTVRLPHSAEVEGD